MIKRNYNSKLRVSHKRKALRESVPHAEVRQSLMDAIRKTNPLIKNSIQRIPIKYSIYELVLIYPNSRDITDSFNEGYKNMPPLSGNVEGMTPIVEMELPFFVQIVQPIPPYDIPAALEFTIKFYVEAEGRMDANGEITDDYFIDGDMEISDCKIHIRDILSNGQQEDLEDITNSIEQEMDISLIKSKIQTVLEKENIIHPESVRGLRLRNESRRPTSKSYTVKLTESHVRVKNSLGRVILDVTGLRARNLFRESRGNATRLVKRFIN